MPSAATIVVKKIDGRWTIGRENWPFQEFPSKEEAIERGRILVKRLDYAKLVVEDDAGSGSSRKLSDEGGELESPDREISRPAILLLSTTKVEYEIAASGRREVSGSF